MARRVLLRPAPEFWVSIDCEQCKAHIVGVHVRGSQIPSRMLTQEAARRKAVRSGPFFYCSRACELEKDT